MSQIHRQAGAAGRYLTMDVETAVSYMEQFELKDLTLGSQSSVVFKSWAQLKKRVQLEFGLVLSDDLATTLF